MAEKFKAGDLCYLREDYDLNGTSENFNIQCKIIELIPTAVNLEASNLNKSSDFVVKIQKDGSEVMETVIFNDLKLKEK